MRYYGDTYNEPRPIYGLKYHCLIETEYVTYIILNFLVGKLLKSKI